MRSLYFQLFTRNLKNLNCFINYRFVYIRQNANSPPLIFVSLGCVAITIRSSGPKFVIQIKLSNFQNFTSSPTSMSWDFSSQSHNAHAETLGNYLQLWTCIIPQSTQNVGMKTHYPLRSITTHVMYKVRNIVIKKGFMRRSLYL